MDQADSVEIYCPNCRQHIVPLKASVSWYCPICAWQFSDAEIDRQGGGPACTKPPESKKDRPRES
ncbi:MAG TPA: hypothetical protein VFB80_10245 [Pirellulaceae bacterium]|nr:hypothetical protein [Pirellulaceae bacterium]